ncbi:alpha/beta fold hydrolase [Microbacterium sp. RD1]|uniref:alpha/beta fold hydrolase n=1 Tax=Microbacterium sp. RD1 TaxID=3457313 RepID=UPI003FA530B1
MTTLDDAVARDQALSDLDWRELPVGAESDVFAAPSGGLARVAMGTGERGRVVLAPGVTGSKEDFTLMLPLLAEAGYRVESYDLAGQYESYRAGPERLQPPRAHYDYDLFVDDLIALLADGSAPAHVLGYSFAGLAAEVALARRPDLFASLTLLSTPPATGNVFRGVKRIGRFSFLASPRQGAGLMLWGIRNNLNGVPPRRLAFVRERFALTRRESVDDIVGLMMRMPDIASAVRDAGVPLLVATGSHDLWPVAQHAGYAARIGARLAVYDTGHSPCETAPHQLVRDLLTLFAASGRE